MLGDVAHFEVALRNAYDRVMRNHWTGPSHWLLDDNSPVRLPILRQSKAGKLRDVNFVNRKAIEEARARAGAGDPDKVIAGLMLGFWVHMTDRSRERDLWIPYLHVAWPKGTDRAKLQASLLAIGTMRNRVAHNERLFNPSDPSLSPDAVSNDAVRLLRMLCPNVADYLYGAEGASNVRKFLGEFPAPADVSI
jgi:hypothetical protein